MEVRNLTLGSLFNGLGGWILSAERNGISVVWESEVERFCEEVMAFRFPKVKRLGDITKMKGDEVEPVDIVTSGSPCQDLSVAGNQKGLKGERSGLFFESVRIVREMRAATGGRFPSFYVWENVPGAFSSNKGRDFLAVIEALTEAAVPMPASGKWASAGMVRSGRCDIAWRVLDSQYWGVPQRRKRIFLVADFRAIPERRPEVLFISKSLQGDSEESRGKGKGTSCTASKCFAISGHIVGRDTGNGENGLGVCEEVAHTLTTVDRHAVCQVKSDSVVHAGFNMKASKTQGISFQPELSPTLQASKEMGVLQAFSNSCFGGWTASETGQTLTANGGGIGGGSNTVMVYCRNHREQGVSGTIQSKPNGRQSLNFINPVRTEGMVRRLTPLECERLQGLPDNYTLIPHKSCSDSARYKAIGNGMAIPCSDYVLSVVKRMAG